MHIKDIYIERIQRKICIWIYEIYIKDICKWYIYKRCTDTYIYISCWFCLEWRLQRRDSIVCVHGRSDLKKHSMSMRDTAVQCFGFKLTWVKISPGQPLAGWPWLSSRRSLKWSYGFLFWKMAIIILLQRLGILSKITDENPGQWSFNREMLLWTVYQSQNYPYEKLLNVFHLKEVHLIRYLIERLFCCEVGLAK